MNLYEKPILGVKSLLEGLQVKSLEILPSFEDDKEKVFLFPEDASTELGDSQHDSCYFYGYTTGTETEDRILLVGEDLPSLPKFSPFAHIYLFTIDEEGAEKDQEFYRIFRNIEYRRYKVNPKGYMARFNTNLLKEGARVSRKEVGKGLSFATVGSSFLRQFKKEKRVKALTQVFITDPSFPYERLLSYSKESEEITVALDHIMKKLKMDCRTCQFKDICDEIEGMRKLHQEVEES